ncbi:MAG: AAA family ATPase [Clostridiaceae bacterium]|jgi:SpoVK/Ycf46/Vps4 family AAA+-type ATPase|nr:AAA family ATPase [Clostridiaceae bacterium]
MDKKNRFLSGVYFDIYEKKHGTRDRGKGPLEPGMDSSDEYSDARTNKSSVKQEEILERELKSIIDDFYSKHETEKCESNNQPPFNADEIRNEIEKLIGLSNIKEDIEALMDFVKIQKLRQEHGLSGGNIALHTAFIGNPGTGKTTVARLMGEYFKALGVLKKGHLVEVTRSDLVGQYVGATSAKTNKIIDKALDGILFIDEAYSLSEGGENDFGKEVINILVDWMEKDRDRLAVFLAGYEDKMDVFLNSNPGLASRIPRKFYFKDYTGQELLEIFKLQLEKRQYSMNEECLKKMELYFTYLYDTRDKHFGNGREVRNILERLIKYQSDRLAELEEVTYNMLKEITMEDIEKSIPINDIVVTGDKLDRIMDELNRFIGLKNIKDHISGLVNMIKTNQKREEMGLPVKQLSYHALFCGSPGTGKTSIARILGRIYQTLGILKKGHVVEVDRSGLVAGYVGQTEEKTNKVIDKALDGILFIDEAYALAGRDNDFGRIAIDTILKRMDDDRDRLIVIAAGYTNKMKTFINSNPGLKDRFNFTFEFKDYTENELYDIFMMFTANQQYALTEKAKEMIRDHFSAVCKIRNEQFGNGRYVRNLFEKIVMEQSNRIGSDIENIKKENLSLITDGDVSRAFLLI